MYYKLLLLAITLLTCGCYKDCREQRQFSYHYRAYDNQGSDITDSGVVRHTLHLSHDAELNLIAANPTMEFLNSLQRDNVQITIFANSHTEQQSVPQVIAGSSIDEHHISTLTESTRQDGIKSVTTHPDDIFFGSATVISSNASTEIPLQRCVASVVVTTLGLDSSQGGCRYVLRGAKELLSMADGSSTGDDVSHTPEAQFDSSGAFKSQIFNIFPPADGDVEIDLYQNNQLLASVSQDSNANPIKAIRGSLLNVYIDLRGEIKVYVGTSTWGQEMVWKEFM